MSWKKVKLGSVLQQYRVTHLVQDATVYKQVTISKHDGVCYRGSKIGKEIGRKRQFLIDLKKHPSTFMFVRQGVSDGALGIAPPEVDGCIATENMPMFAVKGIEVDYLNLLLKSIDFKRQLDQIPTLGSAQKAIHERQLLDIEIPLPNADEQREIVKAFEEHRISVLSIVVESDQQLTHLTQLRQSLLREAMQGQLLPQDPTDEPAALLLKKLQAAKVATGKGGKGKAGALFSEEVEALEGPFEIPENWVWCQGSNAAEFIDPQPSHRTPPVSSDNVPYVAMGDVSDDGRIDFAGARQVSKEILEEHRNRYTLKEGSFIFGKIGTLGKPVFLPAPYNYTLSANLILIQANEAVMLPTYLYYFLSSSIAEEHVLEQRSTMSYPVFGMKKARVMPIPLPPLSEQHRIVAKLTQLMQHCDALEQRIRESRRLAEQLLQTALREALAPPAGTEPAEDAELETAEAEAAPAPARRGRPRQPKFSLDNPPPDLFDF